MGSMNNNNAEHAIKSLALLRRDFGGVSTEKESANIDTLIVVETASTWD